MDILRTLALVLGLWTLVAAAPDEDDPNRFNEFDWRLTKLVESSTRDNVVISPISVKVALATLFEGAKGKTASQLEAALNLLEGGKAVTTARFAAVLRSLQMPGEGYDLDIGTRVYVDKRTRAKDRYLRKINMYNASLETVDFGKPEEATRAINAWARAVTRGNIQNLVSQESLARTVMLIINALYFKGNWEEPFPRNATSDGLFYRASGSPVKTPFMRLSSTFKYLHSEPLAASVIRLPYQGGKYAMFIVLPDRRDGLSEVLAKIDPRKLRAVLPLMEEVSVALALPKFTFEFTSSLAPILHQMGITEMFTERADFSPIAENENLFVSNVLQKAGLDVNELGSTAYAATQIELVSKFGDSVVEFSAQHPFLFFIEEEETHTVVFVGKMVDPTSSGSPQVSVQSPQGPSPPAVPEKTEASNEDEDNLNRFGTRPPIRGGPPSNIEVQRFTYFDTELLQRVHATHPQHNLIISPASIKATLGLVLEGTEGRSAQEITSALRLPSNMTRAQNRLRNYYRNILDNREESEVMLKSASRVLVGRDVEVNPSYKTVLSNYYSTQVMPVNFAAPQSAAAEINNWVYRYTNGFITKLLEPEAVDPTSKVVLLNAMYFKGDWETQFNSNATSTACFYISETECKRINMMTLGANLKYAMVSELNAHVLELPYADKRYSLVLVLPQERMGLAHLLKDLPHVQLIDKLNKATLTDTIVFLPRFTIEYDVQLVPILQKAGITEVFSESANLKPMLPKVKARISSILHKAKIEVNEKGTIAGAATAGFVVPLMTDSKVTFLADHPFLFFLRDTQSGFLFAGQFVTPEGSASPASPAYSSAANSARPPQASGSNTALPQYASVLNPAPAAPQTNVDDVLYKESGHHAQGTGGGGPQGKPHLAQSLAYPPMPNQFSKPPDRDSIRFN